MYRFRMYTICVCRLTILGKGPVIPSTWHDVSVAHAPTHLRTIMRVAVLLSTLIAGHAFVTHNCAVTSKTTLRADGTGGWGIGNSREMVPEEFASRTDKRAFEGYKLTPGGEFMRKVKRESEDMRKSEMEELLNVAALAGIKVKDPSTRLNKFEEDLFEDDDDDLDLSIPIENDSAMDPFAKKRVLDNSITRMDEDTGAPGTW